MTAPIPNPFPLTAEDLAAYHRDGFVILRGVVPAAVRNSVRQAFETVVDAFARQWHAEGMVDDPLEGLPFERRWAELRRQHPARFPVSWRKALVGKDIYGLWQVPEILGPVRSIIGDEVYAHGVWNGRPREPSSNVQKIAWHQDAHYYIDWDAADGQLISAWLPLVPVDERSGCLQFMPGSHRQGWIERTRSDNGLFTVPDAALAPFTPYSAVMEPGDLVLFCDTVLHQALDNQSDYVRWSIDIRFAEPAAEIISKTPRGYYCFSAAEPSRVEGYEAWLERYDYDKVGLDVELQTSLRRADVEEQARELGVSTSELQAF